MSEKILADRYRLVEQIGVGGMAIVYRAIDQRTGHNVAVKVLRPEFNQDAEFVSRFQREAEAASKMTHHNIVNLLDVGMDGENRYLVMEYVQGKTLKELIKEKGRLTPAVAAQITIRILSALQHAHQNGIIHRDIKPQNILVHADGHIKVADFGIARMANSSTLTRGDSVMGSVHYFSPEQASGQAANVTSDLYSVGVVLYEMLTGRVPFDGDSPVAVAMQHLHARPAPIENFAPESPAAINHVCLMAMEKKPQYRYQSAREMATELRMALEGRTEQMQPRLVEKPIVPAVQQGAGSALGKAEMGVARYNTVRRRPVKKHQGLWILFSLFMTALVCYGLYVGGAVIYENVVNSTPVPDFVGMEVTVAQRTAQRAGLTPQIVEINHPTISSGTVILQAPEVDTTLRKGDSVVLTVSKGPATQQLPNIEGMSTQDAINTLQPMGITLMVLERVVSSDVQADLIIKQTPEAGAPCKVGDIVQVTVSGGVTYVPNLLGNPLSAAQERLGSLGLSMNASVTYVDTTEAALHNTIASQTPAAETPVILGGQVAVTVYRVPELMAGAKVILDLPQSDSLTSVRITLNGGNGEVTVFQGEFPANASRHPEVELKAQEAGDYTYRVYFNEKFAYQHQVTLK
ncbi:MAG: Stk1 family PASTA domain-containing Ser/Thr kinase [Clostridia bacterium]|nr:Stk1 family PASTA domain-containing Ser/Thr kinase [Clostridia bacterium]